MYDNTFYNRNQMMGQMYGNQQVTEYTQPLSVEEVKELRKNDDFFSLKVSTADLNRAICTHKIPGTNQYSTEPCNDNSGDLVCTICGARFNPDDVTEEKLANTVHDMVNGLETIKLLYNTIPVGVARQFFAMIPFLKKTVQLYKIAIDCYLRTNPGINNTQDVYNTNGLLNSYRQIIGGGMMYPNGAMGMGMGYPQQPLYPNNCMNNMYPQNNMQYQQSQYPQNQMYPNPQMNNMGVMSGQMDMNPFYNNGLAPTPTVPPQTNTPNIGTIEQQMANYPNANVAPQMNAPTQVQQNTQHPVQTPNQNNVNPAVERVNASATLEP